MTEANKDKKDNKESKEKKEPVEKKSVAPKIPKLKAGMTVKVHQKIKEETKGKEKERVQIFEGIILAYKKGKKPSPTITVRKIAAGGIGVEKIFPILSPTITKIVPVKSAKIRQAQAYYLRSYKKRLKEKKIETKA